jgi:hypothetical protein
LRERHRLHNVVEGSGQAFVEIVQNAQISQGDEQVLSSFSYPEVSLD